MSEPRCRSGLEHMESPDTAVDGGRPGLRVTRSIPEAIGIRFFFT